MENERICPHCGQSHPADALFCTKTGKPLEKILTCPRCGKAIEEAWMVCVHCGNRLKEAPFIDEKKPQETKQPPEKTRRSFSCIWIILAGGLFFLLIATIAIFLFSRTSRGQEIAQSLPWQIAPSATITPRPQQNTFTAAPLTLTPSLTSTPTATSTRTPTLTSTPTLAPLFPESTPFSSYLEIITTSNASSLEQVAVWGEGARTDIAWSPDSASLAVGTSLGIYIYDSATGGLQQFIDAPAIEDLSYFADGNNLAYITSVDEAIFVWDIPAESLGYRIDSPGKSFTCLEISSATGLIAVGQMDGMVAVYEPGSQTAIWEYQVFPDMITAMAFSPNGSFLAAGSTFGDIMVWDPFYGLPYSNNTLSGHTNEITRLAFSSDEMVLYSASLDETVLVWDFLSLYTVNAWDNPQGPIYAMAYHPFNGWLAYGTDENQIYFKDTMYYGTDFSIDVPSVPSDMSFSPEGDTLAVLLDDNNLFIYRQYDQPQAMQQPESQWYVPFAPIYGIDFSSDGEQLAIGSRDPNILVLDADTGALLWRLQGHQKWIFDVDFSPDGLRLASSSSDQNVLLWDLQTGELLESRPLGASARAVEFSPDGQYLAAASSNLIVYIWSEPEGTLLYTLEGFSLTPTTLAFSPDGSMLVSGDNSGTISVWDMQDGSMITSTSLHSSAVRSLAFSPDGIYLAASSWDETVSLWSMPGLDLLRQMTGHEDIVQSVAFSPSGTLLASGDMQNIMIWSVPSGSLITTLSGHQNLVYDLEFHPEEDWLVSASFDGTIRTWGVLP